MSCGLRYLRIIFVRWVRTKGYYLRIIFGLSRALGALGLGARLSETKQMPVLISAEGRLYRIGNEQALDES